MLVLSFTSLSACLSLAKIDLRGKLTAQGLLGPADFSDRYVDHYAQILIPPRKPFIPAQNLKIETDYRLVTLTPYRERRI